MKRPVFDALCIVLVSVYGLGAGLAGLGVAALETQQWADGAAQLAVGLALGSIAMGLTRARVERRATTRRETSPTQRAASRRENPYPAPAGFHWVARAPLIEGLATYTLVEDGRTINSAGFYNDLAYAGSEADRLAYHRGFAPARPVPVYSAQARSRQTIYKDTRKLVREIEQQQESVREIARLNAALGA